VTLWNVGQNVNHTKKMSCTLLRYTTFCPGQQIYRVALCLDYKNHWQLFVPEKSKFIGSFLSERNQNSLAAFCPREIKIHWQLFVRGGGEQKIICGLFVWVKQNHWWLFVQVSKFTGAFKNHQWLFVGGNQNHLWLFCPHTDILCPGVSLSPIEDIRKRKLILTYGYNERQMIFPS